MFYNKKKDCLLLKKRHKKRVPRLSSQNSLLKEGGYLLSRIAVQYHRR